ncbi:MAG: hypothetical protein AAGJ29_09985, partial [Pseudomonadota bacterium]
SDGLRPKDIWQRARAAAKQAVTNGLAAEAKGADVPPYLDWLSRQLRPTRRRARREIKRRIWSQLSGGYRVAKKAMEAQGDFGREQTYYRFEVKARMKRPDVSLTERFVSFFYDHASNYGASIGRPFATFFVFLGVFTIAYFSLAAWLGVIGDNAAFRPGEGWVRALELSWNAAFRGLLILPLAEPETITSFADQLFFPDSGWWGMATRALVTAQALSSLLLLFLFALAVRRKFQIS